MKKSILPLLMLFCASALFAQSNVAKINILSPILRTFNVSYERVLNDDASFQLGLFFTGYHTGDTDFSGFGITPEYRFYLSETAAPDGAYVAPFVRYQSFTLKNSVDESKGTLSLFGGGVVIGKQWLFKDKITLDMFLGPIYSSGSVKVDDGGQADSFDTGAFDGFSLRAGITFGLAF